MKIFSCFEASVFLFSLGNGYNSFYLLFKSNFYIPVDKSISAC